MTLRAVARLLILTLVCVTAVGTGAARGQTPAGDPVQAWRFPVGERMEFSVNWGRVRLGEGSLEIEAIDSIAGHSGYRVAMEMWGGPPFYRVQDRQVSWILPDPLSSIRFEQRLKEGSYKRDTRYTFDLEGMTYDRFDIIDDEWRARQEETAVPILDGALRYFKDEGNPVVIEVLRREEIRVPAGTFQTIVLRPIIQTGGAFGDDGEAELYLSDDDRRVIVRLKTSMALGSGNMFLTHYEAGNGPLIPVGEMDAPSASRTPDADLP